MKENRTVAILYLLFLILGIIGLTSMGKAELHLFLNGVDTGVLNSSLPQSADPLQLTSPLHNTFNDRFFQGVTFLGEWFPFLVIGIILLFRFGYGIAALGAQGACAVITQTIKRTVCAPRPRQFFSEHFPELALPLPEDFIPHWANSFPSGHTSSIFALLVFIILMTKNRVLKIVLLLLAILVGYSRIYLSQHFALDVVVGSAIGTGCALALWLLIPHDRKWYRFSPAAALSARIRKGQK